MFNVFWKVHGRELEMRTSEVKVYKGTKHGEELNAILSGLVTFD